MRRLTTIAIAVLALGILLSFALARRTTHRFELNAYFQNAQGLKAGAPVLISGVSVGQVRRVQVRPELREHPAEVILLIQTDYKLSIPQDSIASLATAGVLGETFVDIDVRHANAPPLRSQGVLQTREAEVVPAAELLNRLSEAMKQKGCAPANEAQANKSLK